MRHITICLLLALASPAAVSFASPPSGSPPGAFADHVLPDRTTTGLGLLLPSGWRITPVGTQIHLPGDLPTAMLITPDGKHLLVHTAGFHHQGVDVIELPSGTPTQHVSLDRSWTGMCIALDGTVWVSAGRVSAEKKVGAAPRRFPAAIHRLHWEAGKLVLGEGFSLPAEGAKTCFVSGLAAGPDGAVFAANMNNNTVYRISGDGVRAEARVFYRPGALALSSDGKTLAVANWGGQTVSLLDAESLREQSSVLVGSHPNSLAAAADGRFFVSNGGSNSVSVIKDGEVLESINTAPSPDSPVGSTPDALAISPDQRLLYVANADNNDVLVVDISSPQESRVLGLIPTGWYPSALAVSPDGRLLVGVGKGLSFSDNADRKYIPNLLNGAVSVVDAPTDAQLATFTRQALQNIPRGDQSPSPRQAAAARRAFKQIKHVLYIIRENRTYDQVFGDLPTGNGDRALVMFGRNVTPNAHAIAGSFVQLDNIYCSGEVSEDGHQWCNAAYATDFTEHAWVNNYSGRGEPPADGRLTSSPAGYLWDACAAHGLTYRSYGEFADFSATPNAPPVFHGVGALRGHASAAYGLIPWGAGRDTERAAVFIDEMRKAERTGSWPQYMVMSLPEDHTRGASPGAFTPVASVGSGDQGLGEIVDAVSHSKFWKDTAIFVIEDDAQDGPDHVDAHRTVGLVISPFVKRKSLDSTFYTTSGMVRTIELILGLPPMSQYDAAATPMFNAFTDRPDFSPYRSIGARVNLLARNPMKGAGATASLKLDFSAPDRADPDQLNRILWEAVNPGRPMPPPVRALWIGRGTRSGASAATDE